MIQLQFKTQRELENFIVKVATPIAKKMAMEAVDSKLHFRAKVDVAAPSSALQVQQKFSGALPLSGGTLTGKLTASDGSYFDATLGASIGGTRVGFYGAGPRTKIVVFGSKGGNAALAALLNALDNLGLISDATT